MNSRQRTLVGKALIAGAAVLFVLATPCLFGSVLGLLGILADVGPTENQQMVSRALRIGAYPLGLGLFLLLAGVIVLRSRPK